MTQATYQVTGLDCAEEVLALRSALQPLPRVRDLKCDVLKARNRITCEENRIRRSDIEAAAARTGMRAHPLLDPQDRRELELTLWARWGRTGTTAISGLFVLEGFLMHGLLVGWSVAIGGHETAMPLLPRILYLGAVLSGAWFILPRAWQAQRRTRPDRSLLMTIGVAGAIGIRQYFEAATVAFLFALSLALEAWSVGRARRAIRALLQLTPPRARVMNTDGREQEVQVDAVPVGARIVVRPGERIPLDGRVVAGESHVNQASITGESAPVEKAAGSEVFAGSINGDGALEFESTKPAGDTTLVHRIRLVEKAQQKRAPSEQWVDRFARYYTPAVMALAVPVMLVPPLVADGSWPGCPLEERGQETPEKHAQLEQPSGAGRGVVVVGREEHVCGFITVGNRVRPEAAGTVAALIAAGVGRVVMLTGENRPTAERIGSLTGVDEFRAELLPEAKVAAVDELVARYGAAAMIGDGVNDAPALVRANLDLAMGTVGSDPAIETADIALMSDDLARVPWLLRHSRHTLAVTRQNVVAALAVMVAFVAAPRSGPRSRRTWACRSLWSSTLCASSAGPR
ncbi:MAG: hypothetical protein AMXMBFR47_36210 [Planctomycetota bacterium]